MVEEDPHPIVLGDEALQQYVGRYETIANICEVTLEQGRLFLTARLQPELIERFKETVGDDQDDETPFPLALLAGDGDRYVVPEGPAKGLKGYFSRSADGRVDGLHIGGRLAVRVAAVPA